MSIEENKATVQRFFEPWNTGDVAVFDEVCAPNYVVHGYGGVEELKKALIDVIGS